MIAALKGSREERAILVRDPNRLVSAAVLGSPRLTEAEIEAFSAMKNVSDEVLREIGNHREWTKRYAVANNLVRNPRTPIGIALTLVPRLNPKDVKGVAIDRNVPEAVRKHAQKFVKGAASSRWATTTRGSVSAPRPAPAEIRQAYLRLAREKHPDRFTDPVQKQRPRPSSRTSPPPSTPSRTRAAARSTTRRGSAPRRRARPRSRPATPTRARSRSSGRASTRRRSRCCARPSTTFPAKPPTTRRSATPCRTCREAPATRSRRSSAPRSSTREARPPSRTSPGVLADQGLRLRAQKALAAAQRLAPQDPRIARLAAELERS